MSYYDDRRTSTRDRRRDDYYDDDTVYANTRDNQRTTALVKRRSSDDYEEEIRRDFSPGGGGFYRETTIRKSGTRPAGRARSFEDSRYYDDDRSLASSRRDSHYGAAAAAGAGAGAAAARRNRGYDDRRGGRRNRHDSYSDDSSRSRSRTPPKRERRKSMPQEALEALGLGGVLAAVTGKKNRSRSSSRDRRSRSRSGRDRSRSHGKEQMTQALKAAILAGAGAAFRARNEDGGWNGEKGKRVLTAAFTAGGIDGFINRDKNPESHKFRDTVGAAVAGIATDRLVNGPRSASRGPDGRRISPDGRGGRSRSRSKIRDLAAGGAIAAAAKKAADSFRGRSSSRGRDRDRSRSYSDDSRSPPRRSRSRSVIARGLSKVGLDSQADKIDPAGRRERSRSRGGSRNRAGSRYADDDYVDDRRASGYPPRSSVYDNRDVSHSTRSLNAENGAMINRPNSVGPGGGILSPPPTGYQYDRMPHHNGDPETDSDSDLGSSSEDEQQHKKGRKRLAISGGLATIATIHAGHGVYQSLEKRGARRRALHDGTISKEEAQKHKTRDRMQDAASIGLAALGIKGAYSEWKEMKEKMDEDKEEREKHERHARKRQARKQKTSMVGMSDEGYSNSAPALSNPFNGRSSEGPYMSGANGGPQFQQPSPMTNGMNNSTQYFDDNPYGSMGYQQDAGYGQNNGNGGGGYYGNANNHVNYPPPPAQGGTGFPPPPMGQPPPQQGR